MVMKMIEICDLANKIPNEEIKKFKELKEKTDTCLKMP